MELPTTFEKISDEIARFTGLPTGEVRSRVWDEALSLGANANADARRLGVSPHRFDDKMRKLYATTDAFIFECMVFWARPERQFWLKQVVERIALYERRHEIHPSNTRILIMGDGAGSDSLSLAQGGRAVDYFDVPGSRTFEFASKRFAYYDAENEQPIRLISDYEKIRREYYDVVISLEVLEHLPDPMIAIADISAFLKPGGIALVSEAFEHICESCPTHLESNRRFVGCTGFMFRSKKLIMTWYSRKSLFKPMEFTKETGGKIGRSLGMFFDWRILGGYFSGRFSLYKARLKNVVN